MGSLQVVTDDLWPSITKLARSAKRSHVAVAYLGADAGRLLPLKGGDTLVVDMSESAVKAGQTDPREVRKYLAKGVRVYSCANRHAKVYIFGDAVIIGSANVSRHSRDALVEAGLLSRQRDAVQEARGFVRALQRELVTDE